MGRQVFTKSMNKDQIWLPARTVANLKQNNVYVFDGVNDYIDLGDNINLHGHAWTACCLIYPTTLDDNQIIYGKGACLSSGWYLQRNTTTLQVVSTPGTIIITADYTVLLNTWQHVTIAFNGTDTIKFYINGVFHENTAPTSPNPSADNGSFCIGAYPSYHNSKLAAKLSMLQVFDTELSPSEILDVANWGDHTANRINFFKCAEGSGLTAIDFEGDANGTITTDNEGTFHSTDNDLGI